MGGEEKEKRMMKKQEREREKGVRWEYKRRNRRRSFERKGGDK